MSVWTSEFYIGTNLTSDFNTLNTVFATDELIDPDCTFKEFGSFHDNVDGSRTGIGFPHATLRWDAITDAQVELLKLFCSGLSAAVYWRIPTNRYTAGVRTWRTYLTQMLWTPAGEDKQRSATLGLTIELRFLLVQAEAV